MNKQLSTPNGLPEFHELPSPLLWQEESASLSTKPGVYWYLNDQEEVLYVGKAKNLRNRLLSYRRLPQLLPRTKKLVQTASKVRYQETETELEALLLEAELVKAYQPAFNVLLKDDKSPLYIVITKEEFPKILAVRREVALPVMKRKYLHIYGPYPSSAKVRQLLKMLRRMFPFCTAKRGTGRACLYHHIGLCPGVCVGSVSKEDYSQTIQSIHWFLTGKKYQLNMYLRKRIEIASAAMEFEEAARIKQQWETIQYITGNYRERGAGDVVPNLSQDEAVDSLIHLRRMLLKYLPLPTNYPLNRIECYDVSNIQGKQATTSMVVFTNGKKDASSYRKFKIRTLDQPNDVGMLKEALSRRVDHPEWGLPNLILIDGGKGQLRAARKVIPWSIPVVSLAKRPDRLMVLVDQWPVKKRGDEKSGLNKLMVVEEKLDTRNAGARILQALRDEAHRFAKAYHKKLRVMQVKSFVAD